MVARLVARVKALGGRRRAERELDEELRFHLEMETRLNIDRGLSPAAARTAALRDLGGLDQTREAVRDERAGPADWILRDLVHAARALRRSPGFTVTVVAALAIGIGGTTLVFSVVEALVIRELPYGDPAHLVVLDSFVPDWRAFERLRAETVAFDQLAACAERGANVTVNGESLRLGIAAVSRNFLEVADVRPAAGRAFSAGVVAGEEQRVVLLSDRFWRARFGGTLDAIGRTLTIDRVPYTIIGVLPPPFRTIAELVPDSDVSIERSVSLIVPVVPSETWRGLRGLRGSDSAVRLSAIGRLRRGASISAASREVDAAFRRAAAPVFVPAGAFSVVPASRAVAGDLASQLTILSMAVGLLFVVACANVANLQLARLSSRRREFAIRTAIGAGSARLVSTALAEMLLLALAGGAAGLLLAWSGVQVARAGATPGLARLAGLQINGAVLAFAAAGTAGAALLAGIVPVWQISRGDPVSGMQPGAEGTGLGLRGIVPPQLVVWQVALAIILVFVGSLLVRDMAHKIRFDPGFRPKGVLSAGVSPDRDRYRRSSTADIEGDHARYCSRLLEGAKRLPGVTGVALTTVLPGSEVYTGVDIRSEGRVLSPGMSIVSADYFSVLSIPIVAGRGFAASDGVSTGPVLVVNQAFARRQWTSESNTVGRQVTFAGDSRAWTIVGVSADARDEGLWRPVEPRVYALFSQFQEDGPMNILLRSGVVDLGVLARPLAELVRTLDADQPVHRVIPLEAVVATRLARERRIATMLVLFACLTLALAAIGVHGILSYAVTRRTREIAVRRALGSSRRLIIMLVMRRSAGLLGLGIVTAVPIALVLRWYLANAVGTGTDQSAFLMAVAVSLVAVAALAASIVSTRRAIRVDPTSVLRAE